MRHAVLAIAVLALAACGDNSAPAGGDAPDAGLAAVFPNLSQANYRAEATLTDTDGKTTPIVMIRSGAKVRMEFNSGEGNQVVILNPETNQSIIVTEQGGRRMAMTVPVSEIPDAATAWQNELAAEATRTGTCSAAGESGAEWTSNDQAEGPKTACVTDDGIILQATENGRTTWQTNSVTRGAQAAELFQAPPGVQVMDLGQMISPEMLEQMKTQFGQ